MNLPREEAKKRLLEAKAAVLFGNAMDVRAAKAAKEEPTIKPEADPVSVVPPVKAVELMDWVADAAGLPKYSGLKATVDALRALVKETDRTAQPEDYYFQGKLHGILDDLDLEG